MADTSFGILEAAKCVLETTAKEANAKIVFVATKSDIKDRRTYG